MQIKSADRFAESVDQNADRFAESAQLAERFHILPITLQSMFTMHINFYF